jgi:hypothetical protein
MASIDPLSFITENLVAYIFGDRTILGIFITMAVLFGLYFMKLDSKIIVIVMMPLIIGLTAAGFFPLQVMIFIFLPIALIWGFYAVKFKGGY